MTPAIDSVLKQQGFELARQKKHKVWKRDDGLTFVTPSTPSDRRWSQNALTDLARLLGLKRRELLREPGEVRPDSSIVRDDVDTVDEL